MISSACTPGPLPWISHPHGLVSRATWCGDGLVRSRTRFMLHVQRGEATPRPHSARQRSEAAGTASELTLKAHRYDGSTNQGVLLGIFSGSLALPPTLTARSGQMCATDLRAARRSPLSCRCHICAGTGLAPATSAPGLGSPACDTCTGTGLTPLTSAPGRMRSSPSVSSELLAPGLCWSRYMRGYVPLINPPGFVSSPPPWGSRAVCSALACVAQVCDVRDGCRAQRPRLPRLLLLLRQRRAVGGVRARPAAGTTGVAAAIRRRCGGGLKVADGGCRSKCIRVRRRHQPCAVLAPRQHSGVYHGSPQHGSPQHRSPQHGFATSWSGMSLARYGAKNA